MERNLERYLTMLLLAALQVTIGGCVANRNAAPTELSFLVLNASAGSGHRHPTWVALYNGRKTEHIDARGGVFSIEPGAWRISHFDYTQSTHSNVGTRIVKRPLRIELEPHKIYYFGAIKVHRFSTSKGDYSVEHDPELLRKACAENPELFSTHPLVMPFLPNMDNEVWLNCVDDSADYQG